MLSDNKIVSLNELSLLLNKSRTTVWRWWSIDGVLPKPIMINGRCLGWKQSVITDWLDHNS